jgi:hypothetical protein
MASRFAAKAAMTKMAATGRKRHLDNLEGTPCIIAKGLKLADPKLQAKVIRQKLVRRIDYYQSNIARHWRYGCSIESWERENERADAWLCYLVRRTSLERTIGQRRGSKSIGNRAARQKKSLNKPRRSKPEISCLQLSNGHLTSSRVIGVSQLSIQSSDERMVQPTTGRPTEREMPADSNRCGFNRSRSH